MKATVYDLGGGIGVALLEDHGVRFVAEVTLEPLHVLPQTVRAVVGTSADDVDVAAEATPQDHVDRMALQVQRLRRRLAEFDDTLLAVTDSTELREQMRAAVQELGRVGGG